MEPFKLTRERVTFLALMAVVTVVVAVAAPFGSIALSALALLAIGVVLIKAMLRTRNWWPLTAVEGTVALSGVVLLAGGLAVAAYSIVRLGVGDPLGMMVGWPYVDPTRAGTRTRAVSYSDPSMQQRLKEALREAGIPFTVKMEDGKEFVGWSGEHAAAADAINEKVSAGPLRSGRNSHFPDGAMQNEFTQWLSKRGVKHEVVQMEGKDWVVWDESAGDVVREFMESRGARDCKGKVAAGKPGEMPC
jgi:hypothetical protein